MPSAITMAVSLLTRAIRNPSTFYLWLVTLVAAFILAGYGAIVHYERLLLSQSHSSIIEYNSTIVFAYAYVRFIMHIITHHLLQTHSPTFRSMPTPIQREVSFGLFCVASFFLWAPVAIYGAIQVFAIGDRAAFMERMAPFVKCSLESYLADRLIHLVNNWSLHRLLHHIVLTLLVLSFLETLPYRCFGIILFGAIHDTVGDKPYDLYLLFARYARRHANFSARFGAPTQGIDHLFIPKSAATMAFLARITYMYWCLHLFAIPWILSAIFFISFDLSTSNDKLKDETSSQTSNVDYFWKVSNFLLGPLFAAMDVPNFRAFAEQSRVEYWEKEIFVGG